MLSGLTSFIWMCFGNVDEAFTPGEILLTPVQSLRRASMPPLTLETFPAVSWVVGWGKVDSVGSLSDSRVPLQILNEKNKNRTFSGSEIYYTVYSFLVMLTNQAVNFIS